MKDCKKIHPLLSLFAEEALSPAETKKVEAHLSSCADARQELEDYRRLHKTLIALPEPSIPKGLHEKIMGRVTGKIEPLRPHKPFWPFPAGLAVAACLTLYLVMQNPELTRLDHVNQTTRAAAKVEPKTVPPAPAFSNGPQGFTAAKASGPSTDHLNKLKEAPKDANDAPQPAPALENEKKEQIVAMGGLSASRSVEKRAKISRKESGTSAEADSTANNAPSAFAGAPAAQTSENLELNMAGKPAQPQAALPPTPVPTEGALADIAFTKKITVSTWSGANSPATVEGGQLITDPVTFTSTWQTLRPGETVPAIDFTTQAGILLNAGEEPSAGYRVQVNQMEEKEGQMVVHYHVDPPAPGTVTAQVLTHPWTLQVIPKPAEPVQFQKD